jgi:hypothetical protein
MVSTALKPISASVQKNFNLSTAMVEGGWGVPNLTGHTWALKV